LNFTLWLEHFPEERIAVLRKKMRSNMNNETACRFNLIGVGPDVPDKCGSDAPLGIFRVAEPAQGFQAAAAARRFLIQTWASGGGRIDLEVASGGVDAMAGVQAGPAVRGAVVAMAVAGLLPVPAGADTLLGALSQAYQVNPQLNSQRAIVRQTDEGVPQALSGYRPRLNATADVGTQYTEVVSGGQVSRGVTNPRGVGFQGQTTLYNGFQTANRTRAAESSVFAARETLRVIEQTVLLDAATAYMNVLRDTAVLEVQRNNVRVLGETLRQTRDRFNVGEVTRTDVAQAQAQLAAGQSQLLTAESNLTTSRATYRRVIGSDPNRLAPGTPVDRLSPRTLLAAIGSGIALNPSVTAAMYGVDVAQLQVKVAEGVLYPVVTLNASAQKRYDVQLSIEEQLTASVGAQITIPLYQGGQEYSAIRQSKELLGQRRLDLATTRDQARATVVQAWGLHEAAKAQIQAAQEQVTASEVALNGVREEARVGQRTTLDVLNAQQALVNARVSLVTAQRDRVVASYTLLSAVGRLSPDVLGLRIPVYDPMVHYQQVRDAWGGVRTADGR
jgi:outer membrane protein